MGVSRHRDRRTFVLRWASTCEHWAVAICGNTAACNGSVGSGGPRGVRVGSSNSAWPSWIVGSTVMVVVPMRRRRQSALECMVCGGQWWWGCRTHRRTTSSSLTCAQLSRLAASAGRCISAVWSRWCPRRPWSPHLRRHRRVPRLRRACPPAPPYLRRMATAAASGPAAASHFGVSRVRRLKLRRPRVRRLWLRHPRLRLMRRRVRRRRVRRLRVRRLRVRRLPRGRRCPAQRLSPPVLLILRFSADGVEAAGQGDELPNSGRVPPPRVRQQRVASQQRGSREELLCIAHRISGPCSIGVLASMCCARRIARVGRSA